MKISPELVVGNTWLHMLERDEHIQAFAQEDFIEYAKKIEARVNVAPNCIESGMYVRLSLSDILDTAACVSGCVDMVRREGDEAPSVLHLKDGERDRLKRKLEIYFKGTTPQWLLDEITLALEDED